MKMSAFASIAVLIVLGLGQTPIASSTGDRLKLVETLRAHGVRAGQPKHNDWNEAQCGIVGRSQMCWFYGESGVLVFGRSGGLLLRIDARYPWDIETRDFDHDGRPELTLVIRVRGGTGTLAKERQIYFFDGQRFAPPLCVTSYSYTDSSWFGHLNRGAESFLIPMLSTTGEIRFRDTDNDGRADIAEAVERRWWGEQLNSGDRTLDAGPAWASARLRARFGFGLGAVDQRVVATWTRSAIKPMFLSR